MALLMLWLKLLNKTFGTGLLTAATVPHESEKRYIRVNDYYWFNDYETSQGSINNI